MLPNLFFAVTVAILMIFVAIGQISIIIHPPTTLHPSSVLSAGTSLMLHAACCMLLEQERRKP